MITVCRKCGANSTLPAIDDFTACPACRAIFSKVALAIFAGEGRRIQLERTQLLLAERSKKVAAFNMNFEALSRVLGVRFRKLANFA